MSTVNEPAPVSAASAASAEIAVGAASRAPTPGSTRTGDPFNPDGVVFQPVSRRLIAVRVVGILLGLGALAAVFVVGALVRYSWMWVGAAVVVGFAAWAVWLVPRQVRAMGYALTADHLLWRKGIMFRRICVVPYGRMQYVDTSQGPLAAWLGIAEVRLHTAAASTDATINGLPVKEAEHLRRLLADRGEQRMAGL